MYARMFNAPKSSPATRGRGLKLVLLDELPQRAGVARHTRAWIETPCLYGLLVRLPRRPPHAVSAR